MEMETVCRTCLRAADNFVSLFDDLYLIKKIEIISSILLSEEEGFPKRVCAECVININLSYNFQKVIRNSDLELKQRLAAKRTQEIATITNRECNKLETLPDDVTIKCSDLENAYIKNEEVELTPENENCMKVKELSTTSRKSTKSLSKVKSKNNVRLYKCRKCSFSCTTELELFTHKDTTHKRVVKVTKCICNVCGKSIRSDNLKKHILIHSAPPVTCKICGRVAKNSESMRSHMILHNFQAETCEICGQVFRNHKAYKTHMRNMHSGIGKTFKCSFCEKTFYSNGDRKRHLRSHTGERPYKCQYCEKGLSSTNALKTHVRLHTHEKPYKCNLCPMAFPQRVSLRNHVKSKHPKHTEGSASN